MTDKPALRRDARASRAAFVRTGGATIAVPDAFREQLCPGLVVASYAPIGSEADPAPLDAAARAAGCILTLPHVVDRATPLRFLHWDGAMLMNGPYGLRQPEPDAAALVPDIILTPLVAFDAALNRIGQGAGHYDRAFAAFPDAWRVGIAYEVQRVPAIAADLWDLPLDAVATETHWRMR